MKKNNYRNLIAELPKKIKACGYSAKDIKFIKILIEVSDGSEERMIGKYSTCYIKALVFIEKIISNKDVYITGIDSEVIFEDLWLLTTIWYHEDQRYRWEQGVMKGKGLFICKEYEEYTNAVS